MPPKDVIKIAKAAKETIESTPYIDAMVEKFSYVQASNAGSPIPNVSVRAPFGKADYESFRPGEKLPYKFQDIIHACRAYYSRMGMVRQIVDMLTDFVVSDMRFIHKDPKAQIKIDVWAKKINLKATTSQFAHHLFLDANAAVKRITASISLPVQKEWELNAEPDRKTTVTKSTRAAKEIVIKHIFLNILGLDWSNGLVGGLTGEKQLMMNIDNKLAAMIRNPSTKEERALVDKLPIDIVKQIRSKTSGTKIVLDPDKVYVAHLRKNDWDDWALPFIYSALADIYFKDKLRLAETAALDGVVNVIRLWRLGDHKTNPPFLPHPREVDRLLEILEANTGGGAFDIIWDSRLQFDVFYPPIEKILGPEKYEQVNHDILVGLGVPDVLLGGKGSNFSNAFIQLKTMTERLKYVRRVINDWLEEELRDFCDAMDIKDYPRITYGLTTFDDENIAKKLIVDLFDRGIIPVETIYDMFGQDADITIAKLKTQKKDFNPDGGIEILSPLKSTQPPVSKGGRPANTQDVSRKARKPAPRGMVKADLVVKGICLADQIHNIVQNEFLTNNNIDNARKLTDEQRKEIEKQKITILACIKPEDGSSKDAILNALKGTPDKDLIESIDLVASQIMKENGNLTLADQSKIYGTCWATKHTNQEEENDS